MSNAAPAERRDAYPHALSVPTRWQDQDLYGHVNNVVYYSYFDTVVSDFLVTRGGLDPHRGGVIGVCVESFCQFRRELKFPQTIEARLRVGRLGARSARYEIGLFTDDADEAAAAGHLVHVFVDRERRRPVAVPEPLRAALQTLCVEPGLAPRPVST